MSGTHTPTASTTAPPAARRRFLLPLGLVVVWALSFAGFWSSASPQPRAAIITPFNGSASWDALTPNGRTFLKPYQADSEAAQTIRRWDTFTGKELPSYQLPNGDAFVPTGASFVVVHCKVRQALEFRDIDTGQLTTTFTGDFVEKSADWRTLVYESIDRRQVCVLDGVQPTHRLTVSLEQPPPEPPQARPKALSPDGKFLAVGDGSAIRLWEVENAKELPQLFSQGPPVRALAFDPTGKYLACRASSGPKDAAPANDDVVSLWQLPSWQRAAAVALQSDSHWAPADNLWFDAFGEEVDFGSARVSVADLCRQTTLRLSSDEPYRDLRKCLAPGGRWSAVLDVDEGALELRRDRECFRLEQVDPQLYFGNRPCFSPDGRHLFITHDHMSSDLERFVFRLRQAGILDGGSSMDSEDLLFWDVDAREQGPLLKGHVTNFSAEGKTLATECTNRVRYNFYDFPIHRPMGTIVALSALPPLMCFAAYALLRRFQRRPSPRPIRPES